MIQVEEIEQIRRAYFIEGQSIRAIARHYRHGRRVIRRAIASAEPPEYQRQAPKTAPVLGPYQTRIDELLTESERQPRKQRYTARKIFHMLQNEGYPGSESTVRRYVSTQRQAQRQPEAFLPLEFDPGRDSQVDWGEAQVVVDDEPATAQVFVIRLNYSKTRFAIAYPHQQQDAFLDAHIQAFHFFGGVTRRITYDNLKTAVYKILAGHNRQEQQTFIAFRSHYLFESRYCTPGQAHEKGGVEVAALAGSGAAQATAPKKAAEAPPAPSKTGGCRVWTASYGGTKAIIIKAVKDTTTNYTVLDVNEGAEKREADAYINAYAKGGTQVGEFSSPSVALEKAFELCPEG